MLEKENVGFLGGFQVHFLNIPERVPKEKLGIVSCNKRLLNTTTADSGL